MLNYTASAEGDCYKHEPEDFNEREDYQSDGAIENMQKSAHSYPFNNYNKNVEIVYKMQHLEHQNQQPKTFKHS